MSPHLSDEYDEVLNRPFLALGKATIFVLLTWVFLFLLFSIG